MTDLEMNGEWTDLEDRWQAASASVMNETLDRWVDASARELAAERSREQTRFAFTVAAALLVGWHLAFGVVSTTSIVMTKSTVADKNEALAAFRARQALVEELCQSTHAASSEH